MRLFPPVLAAALLALSMLAPSVARAFSADVPLDDPVLEARALKINDELRCPVCQGQAVSDSNADMARDVRRIVRERIAAGDSDAEVFQYFVDRYGDFILLRPRVKPTNYVLWFGPVPIFAAGAGSLWIFYRRRRRRAGGDAPTPLSEAERRELESLSGNVGD